MSTLNNICVEHQVLLLPKHAKLTTKILTELDELLQFAPPEGLRNTLSEVYHSYIIREHETLPTNFESMANDMYFLFNFLDITIKEYKSL